METIDKLSELPEINILKDEGITLDGTMSDMVADFEEYYKNETGEEYKLYPANRYRMLIDVSAGQFYQVYQLLNKYFRLNFLNYMYGKYLRQWGANLGFSETGLKAAETDMLFSVEAPLSFAVAIPEGTRVTAGDNIYFVTKEYGEIAPGETQIEIPAACLTPGSAGNNYAIGQINTMVDPVKYVAAVSNKTVSSGGNDEYSDEELKQLLFLFPSTSQTTGTEDEYIYLAKSYSSDIIDVKVNTTADSVVHIVIMRSNGVIPDADYCAAVKEYILAQEKTPITDTDLVEVEAPEVVRYSIEATYYIASSKSEMASGIQNDVSDAAEEFEKFTYSNIGNDINPDLLTSFANIAGAKRIVITSPAFTPVGEGKIGICDGITMNYGGLEGD